MFGYLGGALVANIALGYTVDIFGWDGGFVLLTGACVLSIVFLFMALLGERRMEHETS